MKLSKPTVSSKKSPLPPRSRPRPEASGLAALQRAVARAVMRPLTADDRMQPCWEDGRRTEEVVAGFIKPNDRLTAFDRLEIYNRQYWFRLLDCLLDDYPGLRAVLGDRRFLPLIEAYLVRYPSTSPTLRDLGHRLVDFLAEETSWTTPHESLCRDMARLEWAQVVAFDGGSRRPMRLAQLAASAPEHLQLRLQPHITLLDLSYPVDRVVIRVLQRDGKLRGEASNAMESAPERPRRRSIGGRIRPERTRLLVHRQDNTVYFKRLSEPEHHLLHALDSGASLAAACESLGGLESASDVTATEVQGWFRTWAALGFLVPGPTRSRRAR